MRSPVARLAGLLLLLATGACGGGGGGGGGATPMALDAQEPSDITLTSATIHGSVDPRGGRATVWLEWGADPSLAEPEVTDPVPVPEGDAPVPVAFELTGLAPGETYFYRLCGKGAGGRAACGIEYFATEPPDDNALVVNSLADADPPRPGHLTLRAALRRVTFGGTIAFHPMLGGGTIPLSIVGEAHSVLRGEVYTMGAGGWQFQGFLERDYGRSALYVAKNVTIDASGLPGGIRLQWTGGQAEPARVLAVYGDLTLRNLTLAGGRSVAEAIPDPAQPYTLARGAGLACWGAARIEGCGFFDNSAIGDPDGSRDRGCFGGGVYGNALEISDSVVSGNSVKGYGAAGGGVYSVGGAGGYGSGSSLTRCAVTGNRVTAQHAYGGGVYTDGGGPGALIPFVLTNCTVARNLVEDNPDLDQVTQAQFYYRGGGVYMSNGRLEVMACTIAENAVTGHPYTFGNKPNMGGGAIAATIGNAHVVEDMRIGHSVIAGNTVGGQQSDLYTGSIRYFVSLGANLVGVLDMSQILVPVPPWESLSRKHWPETGDLAGVAAADVLDLAGAVRHPAALSAGTDAGAPAVLFYPPAGAALGHVPAAPYDVERVLAEYEGYGVPADDFLNHVLEQVRALYGSVLGADFGESWGDLTGVTFHGPSLTWPSNAENAAWIAFWRDLEAQIAGRLGPAGLADGFWGSFSSGPLGAGLLLSVRVDPLGPIVGPAGDQRGAPRPAGLAADCGAIEE